MTMQAYFFVFLRDGGLKRGKPKASLKEKQQEEYSRRIKGE